MPMLVRLVEKDGRLVPGRLLRARISTASWARPTTPTGRPSPLTMLSGQIVAPNGSIGFRWGEKGKWNLEERTPRAPMRKLRLSQIMDGDHDQVVGVDFPYFGGVATDDFVKCDHPDVLTRNMSRSDASCWPMARRYVATVFDLFCANYGLDRGLGGEWVSQGF